MKNIDMAVVERKKQDIALLEANSNIDGATKKRKYKLLMQQAKNKIDDAQSFATDNMDVDQLDELAEYLTKVAARKRKTEETSLKEKRRKKK